VSVSEPWRRQYRDRFIRDAHQLLAWGYEGSRASIQGADNEEDREEEAITGYIVQAIRDRLNDSATPERFNAYTPCETSPVNDGSRTGRRRRELDILVQCSSKRPRWGFVFEAKRLRARICPIGRYTGRDGLQCFVRGEYARDHTHAAMVGYVQSHTPERWIVHLQRSFRDREAQLLTRRELSPIQIVPELPHEWLSEHGRPDGSPICIYHIFLDCCASDG